jgi:lambda family phage minor tail protein L
MTGKLFADVQTLEPGEDVYLFDLDARPITGGGAGDVLHFHGYTQVGDIIWQGITFKGWPCQIQGVQKTSDQQPTPTFSVGNIDGSISAMCLAYEDMVGAKLTIHRTLGKYLDGQPGANTTQEALDVWYVERKALETNTDVQFELSNAIDFAGAQLPGRLIESSQCGWLHISGYRGPDCGYTGGPVADKNDEPTSDPLLDDCAGLVRSCKFRFGTNGQLRHGGFPAAGLVRS